MAFSNSHYERLKVPERASSEAIQAAWRDAVERQRRASSQSPIAQAVALADIHAAYDVLSDPQRRAHYDQKLAACRGPGRAAAERGLPQHSANDESAAAPAARPTAASEALATSLQMALSLRALLRQLSREVAWPGGPAGVAALAVAAALAALSVAMSRPVPLPRHATALAEAHAHWLVVAARTSAHPLDGEPLRLKR